MLHHAKQSEKAETWLLNNTEVHIKNGSLSFVIHKLYISSCDKKGNLILII